MISAEAQAIDIAPVDFIDAQKGITPEESRSATSVANLGAKTLAMEIDGVNENGSSFIYEGELDNGIDVEVDGP